MKIFVDVDKTIFFTNGMNYSDSAPIEKNIQKVNDLFSNNTPLMSQVSLIGE